MCSIQWRMVNHNKNLSGQYTSGRLQQVLFMFQKAHSSISPTLR